MNGFNVSEAGHVVSLISPQNGTAGVLHSQAFSMKNYKHASIIIQLGAQAGQGTIIQLFGAAATAAFGTPATGRQALPFNLYKQETAGNANDVLSAINNEPSTGYQPSGNANIFYVIEIDANEIEAAGFGGALAGSDGQAAYLQLDVNVSGEADYVSAVVILSGSRYADAQSGTATA